MKRSVLLIAFGLLLAVCSVSCGMSMGMCVSVDDSKDLHADPSGSPAEVVTMDLKSGDVRVLSGTKPPTTSVP